MTENILLLIFALVIALLVFFGRKYIASRKMSPLSSRNEAIIRFLLMLVAALIAHAVYASHANLTSFLVSVLVNAFLIYGATHFFDRLLTKDRI